MQICFRCDEATNALLDETAHTDGISKNQLINSIVQDYLGLNVKKSKMSPTLGISKEILNELRLANENLAQILAETNEFYFHSQYRHTAPEWDETFPAFRFELISHLADISKKLDIIRKDTVS